MNPKSGEQNRIQQLTKSIDRLLAIQNFGSSGSKFVHALLDNHPNILSIPALYMMRFYLDFWPMDVPKQRDTVIEDFIQDHEYWFDLKGYSPWGTDMMGPNRDESVYVEKEFFRENLRFALGQTDLVQRKFFLQAVYVAYAMSYHRKLELQGSDYIIVYPYHCIHSSAALELAKDFPNTSFLYIWRDPLQALGSSYKIALTRWGGFVNTGIIKKGYTSSHFALALFLTDYYMADPSPYKIYGYSPILEKGATHSRAIQLEELVKNPKEVLLKFCRWIGIPWSDELLKGTYSGKLWWNRPESARVTGFSHKPLARTHDDIFNDFDRFRLSLLMENLKKGMGYSNGFTPKRSYPAFLIALSLLVPFKFEWIDILPTRLSFFKTTLFLKQFPKNIKKVIRQRAWRGMGARSAFNETRRFFTHWALGIPIRSYIHSRSVLFRTWKNRSRPIPFVERL